MAFGQFLDYLLLWLSVPATRPEAESCAVNVYLLVPASPNAPGSIRMAAGYAEMVQVIKTPLSTQTRTILGHPIQPTDSQDLISRFPEFNPPTKANPFHPLLRLSVTSLQIVPQFHPQPYFYLLFGCGSERSRCKWPDVVLPAPLLIKRIQVNHSQLPILLLHQARTDKRTGTIGRKQ